MKQTDDWFYRFIETILVLATKYYDNSTQFEAFMSQQPSSTTNVSHFHIHSLKDFILFLFHGCDSEC